MIFDCVFTIRCTVYSLDLTNNVNGTGSSTLSSGGGYGGSNRNNNNNQQQQSRGWALEAIISPPPPMIIPNSPGPLTRIDSSSTSRGHQLLSLTVLDADGPFFCISNVKIYVLPNNS